MCAMSGYQKCGVCGSWGWKDSHRCPPEHLAWDPDYDGDEAEAIVVRAVDRQDAAEKYMKHRFEYCDSGFECMESVVFTRPRDESLPVQRFRVVVEMEPVFYAEKQDERST